MRLSAGNMWICPAGETAVLICRFLGIVWDSKQGERIRRGAVGTGPVCERNVHSRGGPVPPSEISVCQPTLNTGRTRVRAVPTGRGPLWNHEIPQVTGNSPSQGATPGTCTVADPGGLEAPTCSTNNKSPHLSFQCWVQTVEHAHDFTHPNLNGAVVAPRCGASPWR